MHRLISYRIMLIFDNALHHIHYIVFMQLIVLLTHVIQLLGVTMCSHDLILFVTIRDGTHVLSEDVVDDIPVNWNDIEVGGKSILTRCSCNVMCYCVNSCMYESLV
ncbi:hypothetical protein NP493_1432g00021 [Ridgeia piscesae]|uniref:Uncharacterized protein n=1 Tax=Ridgeia piscesae TaxID=27915 RepID=A0AAD9K371_RIDPI|nr:hypothetical protein NP493_1432g00021 [Ridgeia piscesae]